MQIELIDERLRSHRIDAPQMVSYPRNQNIAPSGGYVYEPGKKRPPSARWAVSSGSRRSARSSSTR